MLASPPQTHKPGAVKPTALLFVLGVAAGALLSPAEVAAQKHRYDLVAFTIPTGWQEQVNADSTTYTTVDNKTGSWCRIILVKSTVSKGSIDQDFESEWQGLIVKSYQITAARQVHDVPVAAGWKARAGTGSFVFDHRNATATLTTMSGFGRCISVVATTNSEQFAKAIDLFLSSVEPGQPDATTSPAGNPSGTASIIGTWGISASDQSAYMVNNGVSGYVTRQYTFDANGTYRFYVKTFQVFGDRILLARESGTYRISGSQITIAPQRSVIEAWSKKDGTDRWGRLVTTQNRTLETVTYGFTKHYFSGVQSWSLVLQSDKVTERDGPFTGGSAFSHAWIYGTPCAKCYLELPN
jgi:hypothetical protein